MESPRRKVTRRLFSKDTELYWVVVVVAVVLILVQEFIK